MPNPDPLRPRFAEDLKTAMKSGDAARVSSLRMILARLKDLDIAGRPKGIQQIDEPAIIGALRAMVKSRAEAAALYVQGGRAELAAKEEAEIAIIEGYLPAPMDDAALQGAVTTAIEATGATSVRDTGRVMAALKAAHGSDLDMARAGAAVKARLG